MSSMPRFPRTPVKSLTYGRRKPGRRMRPVRLFRSRRRRPLSFAPSGLLGLELKFVDYAVTDGAIVAAYSSAEQDPTTALCLNTIAQGDGSNQRDGRQVANKSLSVKGFIKRVTAADQADINAPIQVMVAIVRDRQTNAAQLNSEDVFTGQGEKSLANMNLNNVNRFDVMYVKRMTIYPTAAGTDGTNTNSVGFNLVPFQYYVKLNDITNFSGSTAVVASVTDISYHVIAIGSATGCTISYESRVRYMG